MRTIKFRVWDKEEKRLFYKGCEIDIETGCMVDEVGIHNKNDFVIQQFTGLLDKNKKEIFEGDLVSYDGNKDRIGLIKSKLEYNCGCCDTVYGWLLPFGNATDHYEIIGNIFENPELLEK